MATKTQILLPNFMLQPPNHLSSPLSHVLHLVICFFFLAECVIYILFSDQFCLMPHSVIHCYNCHHGIWSPPFCLLSSTSLHIYPTMLQLQDFAFFPISLTCFVSHHIHSMSPTLSKRPASSIICSFILIVKLFECFVLSSVYKVNFQDISQVRCVLHPDIFSEKHSS